MRGFRQPSRAQPSQLGWNCFRKVRAVCKNPRVVECILQFISFVNRIRGHSTRWSKLQPESAYSATLRFHSRLGDYSVSVRASFTSHHCRAFDRQWPQLLEHRSARVCHQFNIPVQSWTRNSGEYTFRQRACNKHGIA